MHILADNICDAWVQLLRSVMHFGDECSPRGKKIKEILHTQVEVTDLRNNILCHPDRDINFRFMVAEWLWIQSGRQDVEWIKQFNKNIVQFSDDGIFFRGAYGPRLRSQLPAVLDLLRQDPDTRQAVIRIFDDVDLIGKTKDVPCTLSLQLLLRQHQLHGIMTMRSNDLWLGFPYDFFNFSQITNSIAGELGVEPGSFTLQAGSSHIYSIDYEKVAGIINEKARDHYARSPRLLRVAPPKITNCLEVSHPTDHLTFQTLEGPEQTYVQALACKTKAEAFDLLVTL